MSIQEQIERLAIEQAVYNAIGADVSTRDPDNLRAEVNQHYYDLYEQTGGHGLRGSRQRREMRHVRLSKVRGQKAHTERIVTVTDVEALRADENDGFLEYCSGWLEEHLPELAIQYAQETGELLDGMAVVEREHPATPDTIRPNGTLRVRPEKVAAALGNALPATIAGLLGGA